MYISRLRTEDVIKMREYTFTNNDVEFIVQDINHLSARKKALEMQKGILNADYVLKLIRVKEL